MKPPYIGITGFMTMHEVFWMSGVMYSLAPQNPARHLMVGVLVSSKTLNGIPNKWPGRYPKMSDISSIFTDHQHMVNLIHYNTDNPMTLVAELIKLHELAGPNLHGFQLNITWPSMGYLEMYREAMGWEPRIVLQIGGKAMREMDDSPQKVADMVSHYVSLVDDILIDPSGGKGQLFDAVAGRAYLRAIAERGWDIGLGIAGGIDAQSIAHIEWLFEEFPNLSIDAEGRLRNKEKDDLDLERARLYYIEATYTFGRYRRVKNPA